MEVKISKWLLSLPVKDVSILKSITVALTGRKNVYHSKRIPFYIFVKRNLTNVINVDPFYGDPFPMIALVNKMVKSEDCPNEVKNCFYDYKKRCLKKAYKEGRVKIYDCGEDSNVYLCSVDDGKYELHQLKNFWKKTDFNLEKEIKIYDKNKEKSLPFNSEDYKLAKIQMIFYINNIKKNDDKQSIETEIA